MLKPLYLGIKIDPSKALQSQTLSIWPNFGEVKIHMETGKGGAAAQNSLVIYYMEEGSKVGKFLQHS